MYLYNLTLAEELVLSDSCVNISVYKRRCLSVDTTNRLEQVNWFLLSS